jgi:hypothetical protein
VCSGAITFLDVSYSSGFLSLCDSGVELLRNIARLTDGST